MLVRALALVALLSIACTPARAQERMPQPVRPPRALLERMMVDLADEVDFTAYGVDSLARYVTVEREDFNGDGVREWVVEGTRYCGSNCFRWIYRRLPGGRFQQVYSGGGTGLDVLRTRSHGWHDIGEYWHMSCCDGPLDIQVFDGRRYRWRETRYKVRDIEDDRSRTAFRLYLTPPEEPGPQRLVLDPFDAGGGVWISARYDVCRPGRVRTDVCGAPRLVLSSARLPAGRVCVRMRATDSYPPRDYRSRPGAGWCGTTAPDPGARGRRRLVLRPTRADWQRIHHYYSLELSGPGLPGKLPDQPGHGLAAFASHLEGYYRLPCIDNYGCADR
ncbi:MAG: hypothetical protein ACJ8CH_21970 [Microvirga sp.]